MSVVGEVDVGQLTGYFKKKYASALENAKVLETTLINLVGYKGSDGEGDDFNQPVSLTYAHGVSYAATGSGAFALNAAVPTVMKNASIKGSQILLRHALDLESAVKSGKSERAFGKYAAQHMLDMKESHLKRLEIDMMYGQSGLATTADVGTNNVVPITAASWASGIWAGMDTAPVMWYDSGLTTPRDDATSVLSVDMDNKTVTVSTDDANIQAGDIAFFGVDGTSEAYDGTDHNACIGLHAITSTTSGDLFGISATTYSLWRSNVQSAGSADLSFGTIMRGVSKLHARGGTGNSTCICSPISWTNLLINQMALRRFGAERTHKNGAEMITFMSNAGTIDIVASLYCKEGFAYIIQPRRFKRIGPTDVTFDLSWAGLPEGTIFRHMENNAGVEYRSYSHQALFTSKPGACVQINNIVNTA